MHYLEYNEQTEHGTQDFPIAFYHVDEHHSRYNMPFHWHMETEIIHIKSGILHLYLDEEEFIAKAGDILYIDEGVIHGGMPEHCVYECAVFDLKTLLMHTDACKHYLRLISRHQIQVCKYYPAAAGDGLSDPAAGTEESDGPAAALSPEALRLAALRLFDIIRNPGPAGELLTMGALYSLFGCLFRGNFYTSVPVAAGLGHKKMDQLKPVLEYIDSSYANPISLSDLSRIAGMTPKYFCRYFRASVHRTPMDYLNYYRVERACYILSTTDLTVTEASYQCGFNDSSYFVKTFKKYMGITPKQYAQKIG